MDVIFSFQTLEGGQVPTQLVKISKGVQSLLCPYPGPHASAQMLQSLLPTSSFTPTSQLPWPHLSHTLRDPADVTVGNP